MALGEHVTDGFYGVVESFTIVNGSHFFVERGEHPRIIYTTVEISSLDNIPDTVTAATPTGGGDNQDSEENRQKPHGSTVVRPPSSPLPSNSTYRVAKAPHTGTVSPDLQGKPWVASLVTSVCLRVVT